MPVGRDVGLLRSMDAILEVQTPAGSFRTIGCIVRFIPSDLQTGDVVPCDPIARAFEEKDGFLVSGSPILLHDNYVLHQTRTIQQVTDVRFWEKFELTGFHFAENEFNHDRVRVLLEDLQCA